MKPRELFGHLHEIPEKIGVQGLFEKIKLEQVPCMTVFRNMVSRMGDGGCLPGICCGVGWRLVSPFHLRFWECTLRARSLGFKYDSCPPSILASLILPNAPVIWIFFAIMKFTQAFLPLIYSAAAIAVPTATLDKRATTICGQWDSVVTGTYTVYQDLWDEAAATSGSQCTTVNSLSGTTLAWSTSWTWAGGSSSVKSYANAVVTQSSIKQISAISSIPSSWKWRQAPSPLLKTSR